MNDPVLKMESLKKICLRAGIPLLLLTVMGLIFQPQESFISYLVAFVFWFGLALGCLNLAMIHHLTGGAWGNVTRRFFEAGYMTLPVMAVLFVPLLFGLHGLYPWADPVTVAADKILKEKSAYENTPAFALRAVFYFAFLIRIAVLLRKWSLRQDTNSDASFSVRARTLSGPGIVIVPFVATFAFVDWVMSLEPTWFSTVFAIILLAGGVLGALTFGVVVLACLESMLARAITRKHFLDLGNLLLAFVMFWTYVAFSQLLIVYSGNQPQEIVWYLHRIAGDWKWLLVLIVLFQFLVPFFILLSRSAKQSSRALTGVALTLFFFNGLQIFWTIAPTFYQTGIRIHWTDFTAWLGIGGIWMAVFTTNLKRHPLLIREVLNFETGVKEAS